MIERISNSLPGEIAAVGFYDQDRNDLEFFRFMADIEERAIPVCNVNGLISTDDRRLTWKRTIIAARPRPGWAPYFEELLRGVAFLERETSLELATSTLATLRSTN
jgi:hypothetical protein